MTSDRCWLLQPEATQWVKGISLQRGAAVDCVAKVRYCWDHIMGSNYDFRSQPWNIGGQ